MKNLHQKPLRKLDKFSNIFTQLGLVLVLFVVYIMLEHKTEQVTITQFANNDLTVYSPETATEKLFKREEKKKAVKKVVTKKRKTVLDNKVEKVDNHKLIKEIFVDEPSDDNPEEVDLTAIDEVNIKEEITSIVPFISIQNTPIFKGCEGLSEEKNRKCFDKKMKRFVQRHFNSNIANEIGLNSGKYRIDTQFIINDKGEVVDIKIKGPHKKLEKEANRIIKKLPKFTPGKQNNTNVKVRYSLPINFGVE